MSQPLGQIAGVLATNYLSSIPPSELQMLTRMVEAGQIEVTKLEWDAMIAYFGTIFWNYYEHKSKTKVPADVRKLCDANMKHFAALINAILAAGKANGSIPPEDEDEGDETTLAGPPDNKQEYRLR